MGKKFMALMLSIIMVITMIPGTAFAATVDTGTYKPYDRASYELTYRELDDGTLSIIGTTGDVKGKLVIPETINGKTVTEIGDYAFRCNQNLFGELKLPNTIRNIGKDAFLLCDGFVGQLKLPTSLTNIGNDAFRSCNGFTGDLVIPNSVKSIGKNVFSWCQGFTGNLVIQNGVESIEEDAFLYCRGFTGDLVIPNSVKSIGKNVFSCCNGFTGNLTLSNQLEKIENGTFAGCNFTGELMIPESVKIIDSGAFAGSDFSGDLNITSGVEFIGNGSFSSYKGNVVIPKSLIDIGRGALGEVKNVYYEGSEADWDNVNIKPNYTGTLYFNGEHPVEPEPEPEPIKPEYKIASIDSIPDQVLRNGVAKPQIVVRNELGNIIDTWNAYSVTWKNNDKEGTAEVTVVGNKPYVGTAIQTFKVYECIPGSIKIDEKNFPDKGFREYLLIIENEDYNGDGYFSPSEIKAITRMFIDQSKVSSVEGIDKLIYLEDIIIYKDHDRPNKLTDLNLSGCRNLKMLMAHIFATSINLDGCDALEYLDVSNSNLRSIDLSNHPKLKNFICKNSNLLSVNLSGCKKLTAVCVGDSKVKDLNLNGCTMLKTVNFDPEGGYYEPKMRNQLETINLSGCINLEGLIVKYNNLVSLDLSDCSNLVNLFCQGNKLSNIKWPVNSKIEYLNCSFNKLENLDLSNLKALTHLYCEDNLLSSLDIENNKNLYKVDADYNNIDYIDYSNNYNLTNLRYIPKKIVISNRENYKCNFVHWNEKEPNYITHVMEVRNLCINRFENTIGLKEGCNEGQIVLRKNVGGYIEGENYKTYTINVVLNEEVGIESHSYVGEYDGNPHKITVNAPAGATVKYADSRHGVYTTTNPTFTEVGTDVVYYKVEQKGKKTVCGSATVKIEPAPINEVLLVKNVFKKTAEGYSCEYTGNDIKVDPVVKNAKGEVLKVNKDYTVSKAAVREAGKHDVTVRGKNNYKGSVKIAIDVVKSGEETPTPGGGDGGGAVNTEPPVEPENPDNPEINPDVETPAVPDIPESGDVNIGMSEEQQNNSGCLFGKIIKKIIDAMDEFADQVEKEIKEAVKAGKKVSIKVEIDAFKKDQAKAEYLDEIKAIEEYLNAEYGEMKSEVLKFADIKIKAAADGKYLGNLAKVGEKVPFTVNLPKDAVGNYGIVRIHDGKVEKINEVQMDMVKKTMNFWADRFSVYAVYKYEDEGVAPEPEKLEAVQNVEVKTDNGLLKVTFDKVQNAYSYKIFLQQDDKGWRWYRTVNANLLIKKLYKKPLMKNGKYQVKVVAINEAGQSEDSQIVTVYANRIGYRAAAMYAPKFSSVTSKNGAIKVVAKKVYTKNTPKNLQYKVSYKLKGTNKWKSAGYGAKNVKSIKGLKRGKVYNLALRYRYQSNLDGKTFVYSKTVYKNVRVR